MPRYGENHGLGGRETRAGGTERKAGPVRSAICTSWMTAIALLLPCLCGALRAQDVAQIGRIGWEHGPTVARLGTQAVLNLPKGYIFAGASGARQFLEATENIPSGKELGVLAPEEFSWFVIFEFGDVGYVKDDEKDALDADAMLSSIQRGTEKANEERKRRGWGTVSVTAGSGFRTTIRRPRIWSGVSRCGMSRGWSTPTTTRGSWVDGGS